MVGAFLADGWKVFAVVRRARERAKLFEKELAAHGSDLTLLDCDVNSPPDRAAVVDAISKSGQGLDCLINNAGIMIMGSIEDTLESEFREQMETNFFSIVLLTQALLPTLRNRRGIVINISSVFGFITWPLTSVYCASKFALEGFTQSLKQELEPHGVRVALIEPGRHSTALNDNLRWGTRNTVESSIYGEETRGYRAFRKRLAAEKKEKASNVTRLAIKIARGDVLSFRHPAGVVTKVTYTLARLFPKSFGLNFMNWFARRSFH